MARPTRSEKLVKNAEDAFLAAIEVYNKPTFTYREETFAILALNAWELLLKAKLLDVHDNNIRCLYVYQARKTKKGSPSKKQYRRKNRSGNFITIGLERTLGLLENSPGLNVPIALRRNLEALTEVRDNAVHFMNAGPALSKQVLEIGTASVKNFVETGRRWFDMDLTKCNLYLMPIGFVPGAQVEAIAISRDEKRVIDYLTHVIRSDDGAGGDWCSVAMELEVALKRSSGTTGVPVVLASASTPGVIPIVMTEENILQAFPWDYKRLIEELRKRYSDFKLSDKFRKVLKPLRENQQLVKTRQLDPGNPKSSKKAFYNPNIVKEIDKHYALVGVPLAG